MRLPSLLVMVVLGLVMANVVGELYAIADEISAGLAGVVRR